MCGSANVLSPGAPPRNSLSVNPDSETPTIKMTTPEIIGENRNRIRSITPVRHSNRNTSEAMRMDELAAPSMPAVPAAIINASNAADGPCTTGRRTSRVAWIRVTRPETMKMALIMFDDRAIGKPIAPATNTGSSQTLETSTCWKPSSTFWAVSSLRIDIRFLSLNAHMGCRAEQRSSTVAFPTRVLAHRFEGFGTYRLSLKHPLRIGFRTSP